MSLETKTTLSLAVRDFAVPSPRVGSIEAQSGYGFTSLEGQEIHLRVQKERAEEDDRYRSEVAIGHEFEREEFLFKISGRMDGFYQKEPPERPQIEEIKSSFNIFELKQKLRDSAAPGSSLLPSAANLRLF